MLAELSTQGNTRTLLVKSERRCSKSLSESSVTLPQFRSVLTRDETLLISAIEPVPVSGHMTHQETVLVWVVSFSAETRGPSFQSAPFIGSSPCLGSPCLVSDRTSCSLDNAPHSFERWPGSLCTLAQLLACLWFVMQEIWCFRRRDTRATAVLPLEYCSAQYSCPGPHPHRLHQITY